MIKFEDAWARTGYQYSKDALDNVKLGWELAIKHLIRHEGLQFKCCGCDKIYDEKPQYCHACDCEGFWQEWKSESDNAKKIKPTIHLTITQLTSWYRITKLMEKQKDWELHETTRIKEGNGFFTLFHYIYKMDKPRLTGNEIIDDYLDFDKYYSLEFFNYINDKAKQYAKYHYDYPIFAEIGAIIHEELKKYDGTYETTPPVVNTNQRLGFDKDGNWTEEGCY